MAPSPNKAAKCRGRIATAPLAMASMMRAPERLYPLAVVEIDEEIHRAEKPLRWDRIERPDLPIWRIAAEEIAQERPAAQDPDEVARIVRIGREDRGRDPPAI